VVAGGKLTTYRVMARDAVDYALGDRAAHQPSVTHAVPIAGAEDVTELKREAASWSEDFGWSDRTVAHLLGRYGDKAREIVEICRNDAANAEPLTSAPSYLRAEIVHSVTHEGALHVDDILSRRTHIAFELTERGASAAQEVASIVAPLLGWDPDRCEQEVDWYSTLASAEMYARALHDDRDATRIFTACLSRNAESAGAAGGMSIAWTDQGAR
jgi:glycerol-3-phosphate dehydrogenase